MHISGLVVGYMRLIIYFFVVTVVTLMYLTVYKRITIVTTG